MSGQARIDSVDQLRVFRTYLVKFAEHAMTALADAEGEMQRVLVWLETEANTYWTGQIRKRAEHVEKCKDAVRQKKLFKSPTGSTQSAVEEEKALRMAQKRLEEADAKLKAVRRYTPKLQKEISMYKGGVQRLATTVSSDIPTAVGRLDRMVAALEAYAAMQVSGGGGDDSSGELFSRMARALGDMGPDVPNYKPLRDKTIALDRKQAVPGDTRLEQWMAGPLHDGIRELFGKIASERRPPAAGDLIHVEAGAWDAGKIYLERVPDADDGSSAGDSGWYLARADGEASADPALSMTVGSLLQGRPDLTELLALPAGYLIVMDMTSVSAILDEKGKDVWAPIKPANP
jgi:hypothetical protein